MSDPKTLDKLADAVRDVIDPLIFGSDVHVPDNAPVKDVCKAVITGAVEALLMADTNLLVLNRHIVRALAEEIDVMIRLIEHEVRKSTA